MTEPIPLAEPRAITSLKLTNKNDFVIEDMFDGVPYTFRPNTPVSIPADAALHMFAWFPGVDIKVVEKHVAKRWGWNTPELTKNRDALKFFDNLNFQAISYKLVEVVQTDKGEAA